MVRFLFLIVFPAIEIYFLIKLSSVIGGLGVVCWVLFTAFFGFWIIRTYGQQAFSHMSQRIEAGQSPQFAMLDSLLIFIAAALLILPGVISDFLGIFLLMPFVRQLFHGQAATFMNRQNQQRKNFFFTTASRFGGMHNTDFFRNSHTHTDENIYYESTYTSTEPRKTTAVIIDCEPIEKKPIQADSRKADEKK